MGEKRIVLYGSAFAVAGALLWAGFIRKVDPDPGTLVRSAQVVLQFVGTIPENTKGELGEKRKELLDQAKRDLGKAITGLAKEEHSSDDDSMAYTLNCIAYAHFLSGDKDKALKSYRRAQDDPGCTCERFWNIEFSIARMWLSSDNCGAYKQAFFQRKEIPPAGPVRAEFYLLQAEFLAKTESAKGNMLKALDKARFEKMASLDVISRCGELFQSIGKPKSAISCFERVALKQPRKGLRVASLKFATGDVEGALGALRLIARRDPGWLTKALAEDKQLGVLASDRELKELLSQVNKR